MDDEKVRQLKAICRMKPTLKDCAAFLDVHPDTIDRWCSKQGVTFSEFRDQNMVHTRFMIIRNIIKQCENGSIPMLIYASKNLCGWSDNPRELTEIKSSLSQLVIQYNELKKENEVSKREVSDGIPS